MTKSITKGITKRQAEIVVVIGTLLGMLIFCFSISMSSIHAAEKAAFARTARILGELGTPDLQEEAVLALKKADPKRLAAGKAVLARYGYAGTGAEFLSTEERTSFVLQSVLFAVLLTGGVSGLFFLWNRNQQQRVVEMSEYIGKMNIGSYLVKPAAREDMFSGLEDELYKTMVLLREGREKAQNEREGLAQNLADISHQLKTPLATVSLLSELLASRVQGEEEQRYIGQILAQTERLNSLVAVLLTLSRLDAGTLVLEPRKVNLRELIASAVEPVLPLMEANGQRLVVSGDEDISLVLDFRWTAEALSNLVKNSAEHTGAGGVIAICYGQNPIYTQITVEDEGAGFDIEELPHLFERFYRGKNAASDSTGIGLALSQSLIRQQNGELRAENRAEGGARFMVKIYHRLSLD